MKRIISTLITISLIILVVLAIFQRFSGNVPGFFGYHVMYVVTGSMEPAIAAGDAVLVKDCIGSQVKEGEIVCYYADVEDVGKCLITHRVIKAPYDNDGELFIQTKGDANLREDDPVSCEKVLAVVACKLALVGKAFTFFRTPLGLLLAILPILILMFSEIRSCLHKDAC